MNSRKRSGSGRLAFAVIPFFAWSCTAQTEVPTAVAAATTAVTGSIWEWTGTNTPVEDVVVATPERYTLELAADGPARVRFDCNQGSGSYTLTAQELTFGPFMSTRMACPDDSLDLRYEKDLSRVKSYFLRDGVLYLELPLDSGTMRFRPAAH